MVGNVHASWFKNGFQHLLVALLHDHTHDIFVMEGVVTDPCSYIEYVLFVMDELLQQSIDLSILELDDLLLTRVHKSAEAATRMCHGLRMKDMLGAETRSVSGRDG